MSILDGTPSTDQILGSTCVCNTVEVVYVPELSSCVKKIIVMNTKSPLY